MSFDFISTTSFTIGRLEALVPTPGRGIAVAASLLTAVTSLLKFLARRWPHWLAIVFAASVLAPTSCGRQPSNKPIPSYVSNDVDNSKRYGLVEHAAATLPLGGNAWAIRSNQDTLIVAIDDRVYASTNRGDDWHLMTTLPLATDRTNIGFTEKGHLVEFTSSGDALFWQNGSWNKLGPPLLPYFHDATRLRLADNDVPYPCVNDFGYSLAESLVPLQVAGLVAAETSGLIAPSPAEIKKLEDAALKGAVEKIKNKRRRDIANQFGSVQDIYSLGHAQYVNASKGFFRCYVQNNALSTPNPKIDDVLKAAAVEKLPAVKINGHVSALMTTNQGLFIGDDKGEVLLASSDGKQCHLIYKLKGPDTITGIASAAPDVIITYGKWAERLSYKPNGWTNTSKDLPRPPGDHDPNLLEDPIADVTSIGGAVFAVSRGQIFRLDSAQADWQESSNGLRSKIESFATTPDGLLFAPGRDGRLYISRTQGADWERPISGFVETSEDLDTYKNADDPRAWKPATRGKAFFAKSVGGITAIHGNGGLLFGAFDPYDDLRVSADDGQSWKATKGPGNQGDVLSKWAEVETLGKTAFVVEISGNVLRSDDGGYTWRKTSITGAEHVLYVIGHALYGINQEDRKIWFSADEAQTRQFIPEDFNAVILAGSRDVLYAGTQSSGLYRLNDPKSGKNWIHVAGQGLPPSPIVTALWVDDRDPDILVLGTDSGLWWSKDSGETFTPSQLPPQLSGRRRISAIQRYSQRSFLVGTDLGLFYVEDFIPRVSTRSIASAMWQFYGQHKDQPYFWIISTCISLLGTYLVAVCGLILAGTSQGSLIFSRNYLFRLASKPLLNTPGLIKWALFLGYGKRVLNAPPVRSASSYFYGLPASHGDQVILPDINGTTLCNAVASALAPQEPLFIIGAGGAGKTTLLARLAYLALEKRLGEELKAYRPIIVSPTYYESSLVGAITAALREGYGVAVDGDSTISQLQAGRLLILFDGVSEVSGDKGLALAEIIRTATHADYAACRFIVATRTLDYIPSAYTAFHLHGLRLDTVSVLLSESKVDRDVQARVTKQLQVLGKDRVDPLLLAMVLEAGKTDAMDDTRASLYEKFLRRKLKLSAADQISWDGLRSAFEVVAEYSLLRSGNRGHGLSYAALMDVIEAAPGPEGTGRPLLERLERYFHLKFNDPAAFVKRAVSDGILESGRRWRFAHDTFEEYFAASRLVSFFENEVESPGTWDGQLLGKWSAPEKASELGTVFSFVSEIADHATKAKLVDAGLPMPWKRALEDGFGDSLSEPADS